MTLSGTLTDFEGTTVRIDDKPYPATAHVMKVCSVVLGKKARVDYKIEEIDGIPTVTDIRKHQEGQPAPAAAPQQQEKKEISTSPTTPAAAVQIVPAAPLAPQTFNKDQVSLIKATVARGCTDTEFQLLMYMAHQYQLDPIRRQIWAVKYGTAPASIFTGRDGFLEIAHRSGVFDGMESGVRKEGEDLIGWCRVFRKDMSHAFYVEVFEREYSTGKSLWQSKPRIMIQKVAESSCLRRAFSVSGLYCPEEMPEQPAGA